MAGILSYTRSEIVLIEPNEFLSRALRTMLTEYGFLYVSVFRDIESLAQKRSVKDIAVVICKKDLPKSSGIGLLKAIRRKRTPLRPDIPFILLLENAEPALVFEARDAGVYEICVEPVTAAHFFKKLKACFETKRRFVAVDSYVGPDRRRRQDPDYTGPERRQKAAA